ncbi:glycosyltransferase family 2 protein [Methanobrevibacter oralis]|uniref:glycosyltransferase family 2 protein n=1 Tax=Methanobrevibacter oralis TaxID=66851 RepID=UPI0005B2BA31|nr:glycosyltransferase family 2 protein [Methanobrevibacter oralis]
MNKIKISAILAVFNEEKFIIKAIESLINQTIREIEIIIVNDGSSDNSLNIINDYCKKDSRITIINQENMGLGASRNNAMKIAKGEYIAFLDGDDWFKLDALEIAYNEASKKIQTLHSFR